MARGPYGTTQYFSGDPIVTAVPLSIACWAKTSLTGTPQHLAGFFNSGSISSRNVFRLLVQTTNVIAASVGDASAGAQAVSATGITADVPFHACAVWSANDARAAYINGGDKGTNATSITPSGIDRMGIGVGYGSSLTQPLTGAAGAGYIAEVGIWNAALDDAEVAALAAGVQPIHIRSASLVGYFPLWGNHSPEVNLLSNAHRATMVGTVPAVAHPRVLY